MKHLKKLFTLLIFLTLIFGSWTLVSKYPTSPPPKSLKPIPIAIGTTTNTVGSGSAHILFQSKDGGRTWQNISQRLPTDEWPQGFYAGESDLYIQVKNEMYRSKSNLETPVWEKVNIPDLQLQSESGRPATSIAFNRSGVMAYNYEGEMYQKMPSAETWLPIHTNFKKHSMRSIFETSDGTVFIGNDHGLYKSIDKGKNWKQVQKGGVGNVVESEGVLIATGTEGIMRSTDNGEHWEWIISEGGVGIDVERIDGGFAVVSYSNITKSRRVRISLDNGKTWEAIDEGLPHSLSISSIKQIGGYLLCGHPDGIFRSSDMGKTWTVVLPGVDNTFMMLGPTENSTSDSNKKVFKLFVSGDVLYAVARNFGC